MKSNLLIIAAVFFLLNTTGCSDDNKPSGSPIISETIPEPKHCQRPASVRGIHLTAWTAGAANTRRYFDQIFQKTEINTAVIDIKEYEGEVYIPAEVALKANTYVRAIPDIEKYLAHLKKLNIYPIARLVVFKDNKLVRQRPELAVKTPSGNIWKDHKGNAWADPYNEEVWKYNVAIASKAAELGFAEIQFDYIRFPSDGDTRLCRYSQNHSSASARAALAGFLKYAYQQLKPSGVDISVDIFGLTTSVSHDMGIGQSLKELVELADFVSPMLYPSHYAPGEYGLKLPESKPYETVSNSLKYARQKISPADWKKMRPYLQDFSLKIPYRTKEVQDQIRACYEWHIDSWLLWNPRCVYTIEAIKDTRKLLPQKTTLAPPTTTQLENPATNHYSIEKNCCDTIIP